MSRELSQTAWAWEPQPALGGGKSWGAGGREANAAHSRALLSLSCLNGKSLRPLSVSLGLLVPHSAAVGADLQLTRCLEGSSGGWRALLAAMLSCGAGKSIWVSVCVRARIWGARKPAFSDQNCVPSPWMLEIYEFLDGVQQSRKDGDRCRVCL